MPTYSAEVKNRVVTQVQSGASVAAVAASSGTLDRTIRKWKTAAKNETPLEPIRRWSKPRLPEEAESHIYEWIVGRQLFGFPTDRGQIIRKAKEVSLLVCGENLGEAWYRRFMERNPTLANRTAQSISMRRSNVCEEDLATLFATLAKSVMELDLDESRVFNMDETAFQTKKKSKNVVDIRGPSSIWSTDPSVNSHLSIVACGSDSGFVVPPALILPGKTIEWDILKGCEVPGATVTTSPSGFINTSLFERWLHFFAKSVPSSVKRPLVLVLDGCGFHYSVGVIDTAARLDILLVLLPPNATHLLQPLDVAVCATLKNKLYNLINEVAVEDAAGRYSIDKPTAIRMAWTSSKIGRNIRIGFRACGIFPLSRVNMTNRLQIYQRNGAPRHVNRAM
ncbi:unnamed protein product [Phytophthora fragariaefolia]|uniref:Unnamed protein product n=1 Tax=Phytophthora fragariaefolia TaxID=1490495 RepID=A0A9W6XS27_9STRA|nr:unnamed protein product [Phytophthora fragariaefolia]